MSPRSSATSNVFASAKVTLSNEEWMASPSTKIEIDPASRPELRSTRKIDPHEPRAARSGVPALALVSPVGSKKKVWKFEPGRNCAFSGRLNGLAPALFAAALASKESVPSTAVSCTVIHCTGYEVPGVCNCSCAREKMSPFGSSAWKVIGTPSIDTWSACSLPPLEKSVLSYGTSR